MKWLDSITDLTNMNFSKLWEIIEDRGAWHAVVHGVTKSKTRQCLNSKEHSSLCTFCIVTFFFFFKLKKKKHLEAQRCL